ncbi:hypothetical protein WA026_000783 [Henosepilachna vigintioctopunctata]|uniref:Major facilitator superfamily (MFS) profile domain-containing protein n=1 Tax=Henosepilachna vigintioctopunctata TaxID=420089 RepID=A0AAW1UYQ6_9CUCU
MSCNHRNNYKDSLLSASALAQICAVSVKNTILIGFGMSIGFPTILIPVLSNRDKTEPFSLDAEGLSWIGSISLICIPLGALVSGMLTQPLGRRRTMQLISVPFFVSWMFYYFSSNIWHIFTALIISGVTGGLMESPVLTYVAEVCQPHMRGMLSSASTMAVISGVMIQFILGTFLDWRHVALCCSCLPLISFSLLFLIPETPIWLLSNGHFEEAKKSIAWLRGWVTVEEITEEYDELFESLYPVDFINQKGKLSGHLNEKQLKKLTVIEMLMSVKKKDCLNPLLLVTYICFLSHFSGTSPVQTYAINIFNVLRVPIDGHNATALLGIIEMLGCVVCVLMVRIVGKRVLTFASLIGISIGYMCLGFYTYLSEINSLMISEETTTKISILDESETNVNESWLPISFIIVSAFASHMGVRLLPAILSGELFSHETRAVATGICAASFYIIGFVSNKTFLSLVSTFTLPGIFWIFSAVSATGFIALYYILPETEGKSLKEISDHFSGRSKLNNTVYKRSKKDLDMSEASEKLYHE